MLTKFYALLLHPVGGVPLWFPTIVVLSAVVSQAIKVSKWTTAQRDVEIIARFFLKVPLFGTYIALIPVLGDILHYIANDNENLPPTLKMRVQGKVPPKAPPSPPVDAAVLIPFALIGTIALAFLVACGPNAKDQAVLNAATTVAAGYRTLGRIDAQRQATIRQQANVDAEGARNALKRHLALYDVFSKTLDGAVVVIEQINREGLTAVLLGTLVKSVADVTNAGMTYEKGGAI